MQVASLRRRLSGTPGHTCRVLDIGPSRRIRRPECLPSRSTLEFAARLLAHALRRDIIHLHTNGHNLKSWLVTLVCTGAGLLNGRKTVASFGSGAAVTFIHEARGLTRWLIKTALRLAGAVICRNERTRQALVSAGCRPDKVVILSGFYGIPSELPELPPEIARFIAGHGPVAVAIVSRGPEYGLPLLLDAVGRLTPRYPRLGLIVVGDGAGTPPVGGVLATGELPHNTVLSLLRRVNVFVRPTYFDGDASSVREALALGTPVVASDTDFRPEGVMLFRRGDAADLVEALTRVLQRPAGSAGPVDVDGDAFKRLLAVYRHLERRRR